MYVCVCAWERLLRFLFFIFWVPGFDTISFSIRREEKLLVRLEVVGKIFYLLILIVILVFALRKRKYPNSSGGHEAPVRLRVSGTGNDDVGVTTTTSSQLPLDPTYVVLNMVTDLS